MTRRSGLVGALAVAGALVVGSLALIGAAGAGESDSKNNRLHGFFEVPSISSPGARGTIEVRINNTNPATIGFTLTYEGVTGTPTQAHIHFAQRDVNGGIAAFLCGGPRPACPSAPATVTGTITGADINPTPPGQVAAQGLVAGDMNEFITAIRAGVTYANVHSAMFPGGEIRGQIKARGGGDDDDD